ncbi:UDP-N-acetylglucosamine 2-epimerase, partial [Fusobacterium nucleatum]|uniref:UDP-N-acetylglucosamine 2-epimerase n=2 Tax=Fusobacterium TaxID=848 RepID=UPI0011C39211
MKKLLYVTGSRAEYGIMRQLLLKLKEEKEVSLDIVITGMHLSEKYGNTYKEVEKDFPNSLKIDISIESRNNYDTLHSMAICTEKFAKLFQETSYDAILLLGDRYEILPVAICAGINNISIIHIHGGEKTLGNYDEFIRHCITKISRLHLVATEEYKNRVIQLGECPNSVKNLGSLGVYNTLSLKLYSKNELEKKIGKLDKPYYVVLFHPETITGVSLEEQTANLLEALQQSLLDYSFVFLGSNSDTGSSIIEEKIFNFVKKYNCYRFPSLTTEEYFSLLKYSCGLIGNSSSGIIEVPSLKVPTINIGNRQLGRAKGDTVIDCDANVGEILRAIKYSQTEKYLKVLNNSKNPYFQENILENYTKTILDFLKNQNEKLKEFYDIK